MMSPAILAPAATLILWSLVVLLWLVFTRFPAFHRAGIHLGKAPLGIRYGDIEKEMPERVNWVSHNYTHLMEQPTLFYAVCGILAIAGDTNTINLVAAWSYVALRVIHSLWQILVNIVAVRALLFSLSSACLLILAVNAVRITF